jgi:hypothetical protein
VPDPGRCAPGYRPPPPPGRDIQLAALRAAFPGWTFAVTGGPGPTRLTARRVHGTASITATAASARELRRVLLAARA